MTSATPSASDSTLLLQKLKRFSLRLFADEAVLSHGFHGVVIVAATPSQRSRAFEQAKYELSQGNRVCVIGEGVTLASALPSWAKEENALACAELGAFVVAHSFTRTEALVTRIKSAIHAHFFDRRYPVQQDVYWGSLCARYLQSSLETLALEQEIQSFFADSEIHWLRDQPSVFRLGTRTRETKPSAPTARHALSVMIRGLSMLFLALGKQVLDFIQAQPSIRRLRRLRQRKSLPRPRIWIGLIADWYRYNHHIVNSLVADCLRANESFGILFFSSIGPGAIDESTLPFRRDYTAPLWSGLGPLTKQTSVLSFEQVVLPETLPLFATALYRGTLRSLSWLMQLSLSSTIPFENGHIDLRNVSSSFLRFCTIDILRLTSAELATSALCEKLDFSDTDCVFVGGAGVVSVASPVAILRAHGSRTFDYQHGLGAGGLGQGETNTDYRIVWTLPDIDIVGISRERVLCAGAPVYKRCDPRERPIKNILLCTNYLHRDARTPDGKYPSAGYLVELLHLVTHLKNRFPDVSVRWRPHPADSTSEIQAYANKFSISDVSKGNPLTDDIHWADVVITTSSSVVIELLFGGIPVLRHDLPSAVGLSETSIFDESRSFSDMHDGLAKISLMIDSNEVDLSPEHRAKVRLFGTNGEPASVLERVSRLRSRARQSRPPSSA